MELPGIELGAEMTLTCVNAEPGYAKRRESTRNDPRLRDRCCWHQRRSAETPTRFDRVDAACQRDILRRRPPPARSGELGHPQSSSAHQIAGSRAKSTSRRGKKVWF